MTPQEKAFEIFDRYHNLDIEPYSEFGNFMCKDAAKKCALLGIDEILKSIIKIQNDMTWSERKQVIERNTGVNYWNDVKKEIENL